MPFLAGARHVVGKAWWLGDMTGGAPDAETDPLRLANIDMLAAGSQDSVVEGLVQKRRGVLDWGDR